MEPWLGCFVAVTMYGAVERAPALHHVQFKKKASHHDSPRGAEPKPKPNPLNPLQIATEHKGVITCRCASGDPCNAAVRLFS